MAEYVNKKVNINSETKAQAVNRTGPKRRTILAESMLPDVRPTAFMPKTRAYSAGDKPNTPCITNDEVEMYENKAMKVDPAVSV